MIDEYDKPLVDYIDKPDQAEINRATLKHFFSVVKDADPHLRFFFITGVSKFSKVSLFSDLNHLRDITLVQEFASLAGYTQPEIDTHFGEGFRRLGQELNYSPEKTKSEVKKWYNGYRWGGKTTHYNPWSILNLFASRRFANYWWDSGTPTFLVKLLRKNFQFDLNEMEVGEVMFESFTIENLNWLALLFQTGYVTIQDFDPETRLYVLGYPNQEVRETMQQHLLGAFRETMEIASSTKGRK